MLEIDAKMKFPSLEGKEVLVNELVEWMREKDISVHQAKALLKVTGRVLEEAWRTEESKVKV